MIDHHQNIIRLLLLVQAPATVVTNYVSMHLQKKTNCINESLSCWVESTLPEIADTGKLSRCRHWGGAHHGNFPPFLQFSGVLLHLGGSNPYNNAFKRFLVPESCRKWWHLTLWGAWLRNGAKLIFVKNRQGHKMAGNWPQGPISHLGNTYMYQVDTCSIPKM